MESLKVTIRRATPDDRSMLYLLAEENLCPLALRAGHPERFDGAAFLELLARAEVYLAETESKAIAGYVAFDEEAAEVELRCFCVSPAHEAKMVANRLMDWVEGLAISRSRRRLTAVVPADDEASLHLYHRHDFTSRAADGQPGMIALEKRLPER
jgi:ribosomal protein S18 acetylase RimI-like enzyme